MVGGGKGCQNEDGGRRRKFHPSLYSPFRKEYSPSLPFQREKEKKRYEYPLTEGKGEWKSALIFLSREGEKGKRGVVGSSGGT